MLGEQLLQAIAVKKAIASVEVFGQELIDQLLSKRHISLRLCKRRQCRRLVTGNQDACAADAREQQCRPAGYSR